MRKIEIIKGIGVLLIGLGLNIASRQVVAIDMSISESVGVSYTMEDIVRAEANQGLYELISEEKDMIDERVSDANVTLDKYREYEEELERKRLEELERQRLEEERQRLEEERRRLEEEKRLEEERKKAEDLARRTKREVFRVTGYCSCSECCGVWSGGKTSSGTIPRAGVTIAVDTDKIPYGTKVVIGGKTYIAEDTGGGIEGNCIDIYFNTHEEALNFGMQYLEVEYILEN